MIGRTIAHFRITAKVGEGGMGAVYRATDTKLGREVAIKVLPDAVASDPERLLRFRGEARALAALDHPNIVTVYSVEEAEEIHFLVMALVEGRSLDRLIPASGLPQERFVEIAVQLTAALSAAHEKGIVHRDLKPSNVMLGEDGRVRVLDFGLAKLTSQARPSGEPDLTTQAVTRAGVVMGTVPYMSPEQIEGKPVNARSDIFSLGVVLYEMATGKRPFAGETTPAALDLKEIHMGEIHAFVAEQHTSR